MIARSKVTLQLLILVALATTSVQAIAGDDFPGPAPDRRTLKTQEKVDALFEKGEYERAMFIYHKELAPLGDKYAQYMIGFMYLAAKGVQRDVATASAWFRMAAQREQPMYMRARDDTWRTLSTEQQVQSDRIYIDLRAECGDATLIANLVEIDLEKLGSRSRPNSLSVNLVDRGESSSQQGANQYDQAVARIEHRMSYLTRMLQSNDLIGASETSRYERLEQRVDGEVAAYNAGN
jgi:TPR repeat protein